MKVNLKQHYNDQLAKDLSASLACNVMETPRLLKITLNMGLGAQAVADKKQVSLAQATLTQIAAQQAIITKTRKSIAGFKIRDDWPIGVKVTLRDEVMWNFLQSLVFVVLPRVRDFRGLNHKAFDGRGNYNFGLPEHTVFPQIDYDQIDRIRGLDIAITTTAKTDEAAYALLSGLFFPFKNKISGQGS